MTFVQFSYINQPYSLRLYQLMQTAAMSVTLRNISLRTLSSVKRIRLKPGRIPKNSTCLNQSGPLKQLVTSAGCLNQMRRDGNAGSGKGDKRRGSGETSGSGNTEIPCPKCGSPIKTVLDPHRFVVCQECGSIATLTSAAQSHDYRQDEEEKKPQIPEPKMIKQHLDQYVVGQDKAKQALSVAVYKHYQRINHNIPPPSKPTDSSIMPRTLTPRDMIQEELQMRMNDPFGPSPSPPKQQAGVGGFTSDVWAAESPQQVALEKSNILLLGPTGSGKTLLVQVLANLLHVPVAICDCTSLTQAGYVGEDIESVVHRLLTEADYNITKCQQGIIFLDEVDKIGSVQGLHQLRDVGGEGVQQGFLKILEGTIVNVPERNSSRKLKGDVTQVDTTNILFIASGAFNGLDTIVGRRKKENYLGFSTADKGQGRRAAAEANQKNITEGVSSAQSENDERDALLRQVEPRDLIDFGMIPEFVGRMPIVVPFQSLTEEMLVKILTEPKNALVAQFKASFLLDNCVLEITEGALKAIAEAAIESRTGARGLRAILEKHLLDAQFEVPNSDIRTVIVTEETIRKNLTPEYVREPEKLEEDLEDEEIGRAHV